jgi:nucleoside-diphosphate-sugar epimerase
MKHDAPDGVNRVLVTGGAGYLGSAVVSQLLECGFRVRVLDSLLFGEESFQALRSHTHCELIPGDVRDVEVVARTMTGCDAVIHLAGIVGDHACDQNPQLAQEVNRAATRILADIAPRCGVRRFLFASSCSVYGSSAARVDESSPVKPLSLYAQTKSDSEQILLSSCTCDFRPTILRLGTLFGFSSRMRFDLVANLLVARAMSTGRIQIHNGSQWRPFVHVRDASRAFLTCLRRPAYQVCGEIFNAGSNFLNLQIKHVGDAVARLVPGTTIAAVYNKIDRRSYHVSFDKIERRLGFVCAEGLEEGMREVVAAIRGGLAADLAIPRWGGQTTWRAASSVGPGALRVGRLAILAGARKKSTKSTSAAETTFPAVSAGRA